VALAIYKTEKCHWGVKALEDIPCGTFVDTYIGEVIDKDEVRLRLHRAHGRAQCDARQQRYTDLVSSYIFDLDIDCHVGEEGGDAPFSVDAMTCGNVTRFINHSVRDAREHERRAVRAEPHRANGVHAMSRARAADHRLLHDARRERRRAAVL